ncbi:MAG TPA: hypothetical protein VHR65_01690 [Solirubrobacterales bacterium]|jgi:hypothetical protein|nr:hypothetical protein [Solirubrobacterales bacterium]
MIFSTIGTTIIIFGACWLLGGFVLRLGGALIVLVGLLGLAINADPNGFSWSRSASSLGSPATCITPCATAPSTACWQNASASPLPAPGAGAGRPAVRCWEPAT